METNEIMANEEIIDTVEEIVEASPVNWVGKAIGVSAGIIVCVIAYKYLGKPMIAKYRKARESHPITDTVIDTEVIRNDEAPEEN